MGFERSLDNAYTAGLMDADGCFTLYKAANGDRSKRQTHYYVANAVVEIREESVCKFLVEQYGGTLGKKRARHENHSDTYVWKLTGSALDNFLQEVSEFLKIKKAQAKVLMDFRSIRAGKATSPITEEELERMSVCKDKITKLNQKGKHRQLIADNVVEG